MARFVDMCYVGQSFELVVPYSASFIDAFHRLHEQRYGYEDSSRPTQIINIRIRVVGPSGAPGDAAPEPEERGDGRQAQVDALKMYGRDGWRDAPVLDRCRAHDSGIRAGHE